MRLVSTQDADDHTLDAAIINNDGLECGVGWLETDLAIWFSVVGFECGFTAWEQGDDALAIAGDVATLDDDVVAIHDAFIAHGVAIDLEREGAKLLADAWAEELLEVELVGLLVFLDGVACSDFSDQWVPEGMSFVGNDGVIRD